MKLSQSSFRGYDIRGVYGEDIDEEGFRLLGRAYASYIKKLRIQKIVVGQDARKSSLSLKKAFIEGVTSLGVNVIDIGLTLTPIMYFAQYHYLAKGGAIITASHNPKQYNGVKLAKGYSDTLFGEEIQKIRRLTENPKKILSSKQEGVIDYENVFPHYQKYITSLLNTDLNYKVVVDSLNATAGAFLPDILRSFGCTVIEINSIIDPEFPQGSPDPTEKKALLRLAEEVRNNNADVGFAYDCDGDRIGIVDSEGNPVWNDSLVCLYTNDVLDYYLETPIVYNSLCSKVVKDELDRRGAQGIIWKTGHSFIKAKIKETRALFGGELSGHFFFMDNFFGHDDAAYASLRLLQYMKRINKSLKELVDELPKYISSPEIKLWTKEEVKFDIIDNIITPKIKEKFPNGQFWEIDGIRADMPTGMVAIRASQNGPYLTVKFEAKEREEYENLKIYIRNLLQEIQEISFEEGVNLESLVD